MRMLEITVDRCWNALKQAISLSKILLLSIIQLCIQETLYICLTHELISKIRPLKTMKPFRSLKVCLLQIDIFMWAIALLETMRVNWTLKNKTTRFSHMLVMEGSSSWVWRRYLISMILHLKTDLLIREAAFILQVIHILMRVILLSQELMFQNQEDSSMLYWNHRLYLIDENSLRVKHSSQGAIFTQMMWDWL